MGDRRRDHEDPHDHDFDHFTEEHRSNVLHALGLLRRLGAASNDWHRSTTNEGCTVNQALVIHHLVSHGDATPSDLAEWMHVTRGSVTPTIKRLEDLGLLTRRIDDQDGRKQWLSATPEAHEVAPEVEETVLHPVMHELVHWDEEELASFVDQLQTLLDTGMFGARA